MKFDKEFYKEIKNIYPDNIEWGLVGILTKQSKVFTLSYDSKILSGIFEIFCEPLVYNIAKSQKFVLEKTGQTSYPDIT